MPKIDGNTGNHQERRLIPLTKWNEYHVWPPLGGLRHLVYNAKSNGFAPVVKRCGRRVLLDEQAFMDWVDNQGPESLPSSLSHRVTG